MADKEPEMTEIVKKPTESQIMQFDKDIRGLSKVLTKGLKPIFEEKFEVEKVAPKENLFQKYDTMKSQVPKDLELVFTLLDYIRKKKPDSFLQILQLVDYFEQKKGKKAILGGMLSNNDDDEDEVDFELDNADGEVVPREDDRTFYFLLLSMVTLMIIGLITVLMGISILGNTIEELGINRDLWQIIKLFAYPDPGTIGELLKDVAIVIQDEVTYAVKHVCSPAGYNGPLGLFIGFVFGNRDCGNIGLDVAAQNIKLAGARLDHGLHIASGMAYRGYYLMAYGASGTLMLVDVRYNGLATRSLTNVTHFIFGQTMGGKLLGYVGITRRAQRLAIEDRRRGGKKKSKGRKTRKSKKTRKGKKGRKSRRKH